MYSTYYPITTELSSFVNIFMYIIYEESDLFNAVNNKIRLKL